MSKGKILSGGGGAEGVSLTTRPCPQENADILLLTALRDKTAEVREADSPMYLLPAVSSSREQKGVAKHLCNLPFYPFS